ncbi:hypothetical protein B1757_02940 [Acidithiobacillus marinus]|uniref:Uncharacterized protein n=1 Tax=Acidithiobacillus marinus TaxID=187490 RepID=A0A2I1DPF9_9PROT|nr:hypothetical protein [Acidithiobacillus marinus]PKY11763.1 hypothetical protein B1757_02940 [Acidithiobacillus marinus]
MEDFISNLIGNGILIFMIVAVFFGTTADIGYVAAGGSGLIIAWVFSLYLRHPEKFKLHKKH